MSFPYIGIYTSGNCKNCKAKPRMPNWLVGLQVDWSVGPAFGWYQADQPCDGGEDPKLPRSGERDHISQGHPGKSSNGFWLEVDIFAI